MTHRRCLTFVLFASIAFGAPRLARADTSPQDRAAARALFDEGRTLTRAGKYAEACPKLEESQRLDPGIGTLYNLADCYEHVGRTASAWSAFREAADGAKRAGEAERERVARARADKLDPALPRLTFVRSTPDVKVSLDGQPLGEGALGAGLPVDPGHHVVEASAPSKKGWKTEVDATSGAPMTIAIPALEDEPAPAPAAPPPAAPAPSAPPPTTEAPASTWQRPAALAVGAAGLVGLGIGSFLGLTAGSQWSDAQGHCPNNVCDATGYASWSSAKTSAAWATVSFAVGGIALAAGVVLWLTAPSSSTASRTGLVLEPGRVGAEVDF